MDRPQRIRKKRCRFSSIGCLLIIFCFCNEVLAKQKVVKIATLKDYAPLVFVTGEDAVVGTFHPGEVSEDIQGFSWDVVRESFHEIGYTIELAVVPWARAMYLLDTEQVDLLFPAGKNKQRVKKFNYSREFVNRVNYVVYLQASDPRRWQGLKSMRGVTVGVKRGFSYGDDLANLTHIELYSVSIISEGFAMLQESRIDGFLGYETNWDYVLQKQGWSDRFRKLPLFESSHEFIVSLKSNPKGQGFLEDFDKGKQKLLADKRIAQLHNKWRILE